MANLLRDGANWLNSQFENHVSDDGLYRFAEDGAELTFPMTLGQTEPTRESADGITMKMTVNDITFSAANLVVAAQPREPTPGDEIEISIAGVVRKLEIASPGGNAPAWKYSDPHKTRIRVHVKEIEDLLV